jgi:5-methylcytosine-specific restriction endonuclease McrA
MGAAKNLTREDILRAMRVTKSNKQASRYLNVNYNTYKTYARSFIDKESGKTLYEIHKNQNGVGIPRFYKALKKDIPLDQLLLSNCQYPTYPISKLKFRLIYEHVLPEECNCCGFKEQRITDYKIPLMVNFINKNKTDWDKDNLEFLCYNCYFLKVGDVFKNKDISDIDHFNEEKKMEDKIWEMDENMKEHFKELGLIGDEPKSEFDFTDYKTD